MSSTTFGYDTIPYPSYTFPQTHPDRLSTIGSLYGIATAHPEDCRVLELGCGDGTNLLSFAYALPNSRFVGVDLSATHISKANNGAAELALSNISFRQADIAALTAGDLGEFDFIIAHGLLSWVPERVRGHILRIFSQCLTENGIGYISYNTYPGCHIREISSEIMKLGAENQDDPVTQVTAGRSFLEHIANAAEEDSLYQAVLKIELSHIIDRSEQNVYHDDLSEVNRPFYFREFADMLASSNMKFISEADAAASHAGRLSQAGQKLLFSAGDERLVKEQLIDLITCKRFRCSIICRSERTIRSAVEVNSIRDLLISGRIDCKATVDDLRSDAAVTFTGSDGTTVSIEHPLTKAALVHLRAIYANRVDFDDLIRKAAGLLGSESPRDADITRTANFLTQFYAAGLISLHRYHPVFADRVSERPEASRFARWQLQNGGASVTSLAGPNLVPGNAVTKRLLLLLDGKYTRAEIMKDLEGDVDLAPSEVETFRSALPSMMDAELAKFLEAGLLIS